MSISISEVFDMYYKQELSVGVIAEKFNTYPNKIARLIKKNGGKLRDKSEAQKLALESDRNKHPTKGRKRTFEEKMKLSKSMTESWGKISEKEREKRVEKAKERWDNMSEAEKENLRRKGGQAMREASINGSKLEKFILKGLKKNNYEVIFHTNTLLSSRDDLEVDMFIPSLRTAIEIDGPTHFLPVFGEDKLQRHIKADAHKNGLLLNAGFVVIRVKNIKSQVSLSDSNNVLQSLLKILSKISEKFPDKGNRFIELEV